jgi:hypothetical protein
VPADAGSPCDYHDLSLQVSAIANPGTYCGTTTVRGTGVSFLPGEYVFRDGMLTIGHGGEAMGADVLFYFEGSGAGLNVANGGDLQLSGRRSGELAGVLLYAARDCEDCEIIVNSGGAASFEGTVYAPSTPFTVETHFTNYGASYALFVVSQLVLRSAGELEITNDYSGSPVPLAYYDAANIRLLK